MCSPFGPLGQIVCGSGIGYVAGGIVQDGADQANVDTWVLATPIDASGNVVGEPVVVLVSVGIELSGEEQFELVEQAVEQVAEAQPTTMEVDGESVPVPPDGATMVQVIPQNGDTFVVMDDVENIGGL